MHFASDYSPMFMFAFITFVISNLLIGLSNALARGEGKVKLYSMSNFILGISTIILNLIFILGFKSGAEGLLWSNTIANIATAIVIFVKLKLSKYFGKVDMPTMKSMIKYSIPLVPNSISWAIINMSDRIILTQMIDSAANGIYAMANKFPNIINVLYGYFYTAWKESAARIIKEENSKEYYNTIYHDTKRFLYAVTICLIAVMPFVFPIFINEAYAEAYIYIPIIMIATYYANLSSFYGGIFGAYKQTKIMGTTTLVAAGINLVIDLIFVMQFKIYAACISTLVADMIIYFYRREKIKKYIKLKELKWQGPAILLVIICLAYYIKYIPNINMAFYWIINVITLILAISYSIANNYEFLKAGVVKIKGKIRIKRNKN
jgi:O-antigen/teichoic acid export membrane protein